MQDSAVYPLNSSRKPSAVRCFVIVWNFDRSQDSSVFSSEHEHARSAIISAEAMKELTRWKSVQIKHLCVCDKDYWLKNFIREMRTTFPGFLIHTLLTCRMKTVDCSVQHQKPRTPVQVRSQVFCTQRMISVVKNNKRHMRFQQPTELLH